MKVKGKVLLIAPFLIMLGVTFGAGRYSAMVSSFEGHGAKGAYGYDLVLILALLMVAGAVIGTVAYSKLTSKKAKSDR